MEPYIARDGMCDYTRILSKATSTSEEIQQKVYIRQERNHTKQDIGGEMSSVSVQGPMFSVTSWKARRLHAELARK